MNENDLRNDPNMKEWFEEIDAVAAGISRWLATYPEVRTMLNLMEKTANDLHVKHGDIDRCVLVSGKSEHLLWELMDAANWLGENYEYGDIWQVAYYQALREDK